MKYPYTWDCPRLTACGWQLCSLVCFGGSLAVESGLVPGAWIGFLEPIPMQCLAHFWCRRRAWSTSRKHTSNMLPNDPDVKWLDLFQLRGPKTHWPREMRTHPHLFMLSCFSLLGEVSPLITGSAAVYGKISFFHFLRFFLCDKQLTIQNAYDSRKGNHQIKEAHWKGRRTSKVQGNTRWAKYSLVQCETRWAKDSLLQDKARWAKYNSSHGS